MAIPPLPVLTLCLPDPGPLISLKSVRARLQQPRGSRVAGMGQYFGVCTAAIRSGHGPHYLSTTALDNVDIDTAVDNVDIDTAGVGGMFSNVTPVSAVSRYPVGVWCVATGDDK